MNLAYLCGLENIELGSVEDASLLSLMECPVCLDHITPPVKQCIKGHLVCIDCFPRLHHCPTCRSSMCQERNLAMEQVSRLLRYPCRYHPMGCKEAFPLEKKSAHEPDCPFLQLKCPFHGQCAFNGSLTDVIPHLASDHSVTPVPVQPAGTLFYRAKNFYRRNLWALIFMWEGNLFKFIVKHIHASAVKRPENCNILIAHVQYIGPDSMASTYAYEISLFDTNQRKAGHKFQGQVTSTLKAIESQCAKEDVFIATFHDARTYTDQWSNLNFIIQLKKMVDEVATPSASSTADTSAVASTSDSVPELMDESSGPTPSTSADALRMTLPLPTSSALSN